jgi:hypothetical protein
LRPPVGGLKSFWKSACAKTYEWAYEKLARSRGDQRYSASRRGAELAAQERMFARRAFLALPSLLHFVRVELPERVVNGAAG